MVQSKPYLINSIIIQLRATGNVLPADSVVHIRLDATGRDSIDSDLLVTKVNSHAAHKGLNSTLATTVDSMLWHTLGLTRNAAHQNQPSTNLEGIVRLLGNKELATSVDVENTVKLLGGNVLDVAKGDDTAVGADNVELAPGLLGLGEHGDDLVDIRHVGLDGDGVAAGRLDLGDDFFGRLGAVGVVDDYLCATASELEGHFTADTSACIVVS